MKFPKGHIVGEDVQGAPIWSYNGNKVKKWHDEFKMWLNNELAIHQSDATVKRVANMVKIINRIENHWLVTEK